MKAALDLPMLATDLSDHLVSVFTATSLSSFISSFAFVSQFSALFLGWYKNQ
jgi:hypothetical protein